eukprot:CAMPEP_0167806348 /NCGR_PEP_ID=MMETSP0111_2-20121227/21783_1 /TAXON_ID=91324 /ORGANISM="Lotharella globosa, Strain CCCM811" /LENGTH=51 /DNA_ID=CAMNT_0007703801 /DNA_START=157 /DNA_END=309 /DNA_ORIENTATION=+
MKRNAEEKNSGDSNKKSYQLEAESKASPPLDGEEWEEIENEKDAQQNRIID